MSQDFIPTNNIIGYTLIYLENSDAACESKVRLFSAVDAARGAMQSDFEAQDKIIGFPTGSEDEDEEHFRFVSEDKIFVQDGLNTFRWEVQPAILEDMPVRYPIMLTIGDWGGDGHEMNDEYRFFSNKPIEAVREAHYRIKETTGIDIESVCSDRHNDALDEATMARLQKLGYELDPYIISMGGVLHADEMLGIWKFLLQKADPELKLEFAPDPFQNIQFYGYDEKHRHVGSVGYGLY